MNIHVRLETPADYPFVEALTREAFWGFSRPTCDEHYLVHLLRNVPAFVPELDYVAEIDGQLVGSILYTRAEILNGDKNKYEVLTFGPLSVLPAYWRHGVGSALVRHSIREAKRLGYRAVILYGHPDYYPRFGFCNAGVFGITTPDGKNFDSFMALPLYDGALDGITGTFREDPSFSIDPKAAEAFDAAFPHKEPAKMHPIDILLDKLSPSARRAFSIRAIKTLAWLNRLSGREILQWEGIKAQDLARINQVLREYGYAEKLLPSSYILQLAEMGVRIPAVTIIRRQNGISVYRVESEGVKMVLKVFDTAEDAAEIKNYMLLASLGVPTLPLLKHTRNALLLPDIQDSEDYRPGMESDLSDVKIARALAHWYKVLHEKGRAHLSFHTSAMYDETDRITLPNMERIARKTNTLENPLWAAIRENFNAIRRRIDALSRTLTYNDFHWTNLFVAKQKTSALPLDLHLLGKGYAYSDIRNVTNALTGSAKEAFLQAYGKSSLNEEERRADAFLSPLVALDSACRHEVFPAWAQASLAELHGGILLKNLEGWLAFS